MTLAIIDYGVGNVRAFANIYNQLGISCRLACASSELEDATHIILPGVGAFDWAMQRFTESGMREPLEDLVAEKAVKVLGVCVGMQMLARSSEEGHMHGLGWIPGVVRRFNKTEISSKIPLPHMGWNEIRPVYNHPLFLDIDTPRYYFLHSYYFEPDSNDVVVASAEYGGRFAAAVGHNHVLGVQFHPEKSHHWGVGLLRNFARL